MVPATLEVSLALANTTHLNWWLSYGSSRLRCCACGSSLAPGSSCSASSATAPWESARGGRQRWSVGFLLVSEWRQKCCFPFLGGRVRMPALGSNEASKLCQNLLLRSIYYCVYIICSLKSLEKITEFWGFLRKHFDTSSPS